MAAIKRERSTNWEKEEKQLLREIIKPFIEIIEKKDLTTNTNKTKLKAWAEVTEKFNMMNKQTRDKKQIMNQWKLTKINSKKELSKFRQEINKTGGGPKPPSPTPETLELVNLIPQEFEVDSNEYDCDGVRLEQAMMDTQSEPSAPPITPKKSERKTPVSKKNKFDFTEASFRDMHHFRVLENERLQKEHELRMQHSKELHEQTLKNLKVQQQILNKQLENLNK